MTYYKLTLDKNGIIIAYTIYNKDLIIYNSEEPLILYMAENKLDLNNSYYKDGNVLPLPLKPDNYHTWDSFLEQWQKPEGYLQTIQSENTTRVNQLASQKILSKYPIYLQLNLPYDFGQDSVEVETMRSWIDSVRTLANAAKAEIASATTLPEITTIVDTFKQELAEIS